MLYLTTIAVDLMYRLYKEPAQFLWLSCKPFLIDTKDSDIESSQFMSIDAGSKDAGNVGHSEVEIRLEKSVLLMRLNVRINI